MDANKIRGGIVFDFDDTIAATRKTRTRLLRKVALSTFGVKIDKQDIDHSWGKPFDELIADILPDVDLGHFLTIYAAEMGKSSPKILPGVLELFSQAKQENFAILVLSSGSNKLVHQDLDVADLSKYIIKVWGYEDTSTHKPNPGVLDPILLFAKRIGISRNSLIYIGDSIWDYHVANAQELVFIAVLTGSDEKKGFVAEGLNTANIAKDMTSIKIKNHAVFVKNKRVAFLQDK